MTLLPLKVRIWFVKHRLPLSLSFVVWVLYGFMTNASDLNSYSLYQAGSQSLVEFQTFSLGHTTFPFLRDAGGGDAFFYQGLKLPAKQPGIFLFNAIPYFLIHHLFHLSYERQYDLVSALSNGFSVALLLSLSVGALFCFLRLSRFSQATSVFCALTYGLASNLFPYSGIPHHDACAAALLVFVLWLLKRASFESGVFSVSLAGFILGLIPFFSMLPALIVLALAIYGLIQGGWQQKLAYIFAAILGLLPLCFYNSYYFGHFWIQANMAGHYDDTFFKPGLVLFLEHFKIYFATSEPLSITLTMPVVLAGFFGFLFYSAFAKRERIFFVTASLLHLLYICNITTVGHCQFGPRYFLPLVPLWCIGLAAILGSRSGFWQGSVFALGTYSLVVNTVGALGNTMYCQTNQFAFFYNLAHFRELLKDRFPLAWACLFLSVIVFAMAIKLRLKHRRAQISR